MTDREEAGSDGHSRTVHPRVVRVIARLNIGGPARHAIILEEGLSSHGFESRLVYGSTATSEGNFERLLAGRTVNALKIRGLGRRVSATSDLRALWHLLKIVFREKPDIIHTHTAKAGALGRVAGVAFNLTRGRRRRCVLVHTFHGHVLDGYFGWAGNAAVRFAERTLGRVTDCIVTISARQRDDIADRFRIAPRDRVRLIPLGLDLDALFSAAPNPSDRNAFGFAAEDLVIGYVGRLVPIKDLDTLLRAFAILAQDHPSTRLLIVGDGELRLHLETLARSLRISSLVHFVGWQHDLVAVYGAMDIVALTSKNEGTPVALIEALAAGRPVVATAVGGVPDVVRNEVTGLLVPAGDPAALAVALGRLSGDASLRTAMGERGREDVRSRFGHERLVRDISALYRDLLGARRV